MSYDAKGFGESFPLRWLNIGLRWKITKIRTTLLFLVSHPKQLWHSPKRVLCFYCEDCENASPSFNLRFHTNHHKLLRYILPFRIICRMNSTWPDAMRRIREVEFSTSVHFVANMREVIAEQRRKAFSLTQVYKILPSRGVIMSFIIRLIQGRTRVEQKSGELNLHNWLDREYDGCWLCGIRPSVHRAGRVSHSSHVLSLWESLLLLSIIMMLIFWFRLLNYLKCEVLLRDS